MKRYFTVFILFFFYFTSLFTMERMEHFLPHHKSPCLSEAFDDSLRIQEKKKQKFSKFVNLYQNEDMKLLMSSLLLKKRKYENQLIEQETHLMNNIRAICPFPNIIDWNEILFVVEKLKQYQYDHKNTTLMVKHAINPFLLSYIKKQLNTYNMSSNHFNIECNEGLKQSLASPSMIFSSLKEGITIENISPGIIVLPTISLSSEVIKGNIIAIVSCLHKNYMLYDSVMRIFADAAFDKFVTNHQRINFTKEALSSSIHNNMVEIINSTLPVFSVALTSKKKAEYLQHYFIKTTPSNIFLSDLKQLLKIVTFWEKCEWVCRNILTMYNIKSLEACEWFNTLLLRDGPFKSQLIKIMTSNNNLNR